MLFAILKDEWPVKPGHAPRLDHPRQAGRPRLDQGGERGQAHPARKRANRRPRSATAARSTRWRAACCRSRSAKRPSSPGACSTRPRPMTSPSASARKPIRSTPKGRSSRRATCGRRSSRSRPCCPRFTGEIEQVPPAYSALKIDGKAAYARARAGETVELKPRMVTIHELSIRHPRESGGPASLKRQRDSRLRGNDEVTLSATVSKGTYIRCLARDIAHALEYASAMSPCLRRTRAGPFALESAISLDFLEEAAKARRTDEAVLPLDSGAGRHPGPPRHPRPGPSAPSWAAAVRVPRKAGASTGDVGGNSRSRWSKPRPTAFGSSGGSILDEAE